jgi:hypothetical protein
VELVNQISDEIALGLESRGKIDLVAPACLAYAISRDLRLGQRARLVCTDGGALLDSYQITFNSVFLIFCNASVPLRRFVSAWWEPNRR